MTGERSLAEFKEQDVMCGTSNSVCAKSVYILYREDVTSPFTTIEFIKVTASNIKHDLQADCHKLKQVFNVFQNVNKVAIYNRVEPDSTKSFAQF